MANNNTRSIEVKDITLFDVNGESYLITKAVTGFFYYESIFKPFVSGVINVADSGSNLIGTLPIQGGERVLI